jgi:hypothetical protein
VSYGKERHLGDLSVFDENDRIVSFSGHASQRQLLMAWQDAADIKEWYDKYKEDMFPGGRILGDTEEGRMFLSSSASLTPFAFMHEFANQEGGARRAEWLRLARTLIPTLDPKEAQSMGWGGNDDELDNEPFCLVKMPIWPKNLAYSQEVNLREFKFKKVVKVYPIHYLAKMPWHYTDIEWDWLKQHGKQSSQQLSLDNAGMREQRLSWEFVFSAWRHANPILEVRKPVLEVMPYVVKQIGNEELSERETRNFMQIVRSWSKKAPMDAATLWVEAQNLTFRPNVLKDFADVVGPLTARLERKKLSKIMLRQAVKTTTNATPFAL